MTFQETVRCPNCLELGKLRYQYGNYVCDKCEQTFRPDYLTRWMRAFEAGIAFEAARANGFLLQGIPFPDQPALRRCDQCGNMKSGCAADEGDGGWWCPDCMKAWELKEKQRWEDGSPL